MTTTDWFDCEILDKIPIPDGAAVDLVARMEVSETAAKLATQFLDYQPTGVNVYGFFGGVYELHVGGYYECTNIGKAQYVANAWLNLFSKSSRGELYVRGLSYTNCSFTRGVCKFVEGANCTVIDYDLWFYKSFDNTALSTGVTHEGSAVLEEPIDRTEENTFTFGGVSLGDYAELVEISTDKQPQVVIIPRSVGARVKPDRGDSRTKLGLVCYKKIPVSDPGHKRTELETALHDFVKDLWSTASVKDSLVGNGNTFENCVPISFTPNSTNQLWTSSINIEFCQEYDPSD